MPIAHIVESMLIGGGIVVAGSFLLERFCQRNHDHGS